FLALAAAFLVSACFAACGLIVALWADKFEQVNFLPTFVITPLTFLGGVFYSATMLSPRFQALLHLNPIYYLIEAMRFALIGRSRAQRCLGPGAGQRFPFEVAQADVQRRPARAQVVEPGVGRGAFVREQERGGPVGHRARERHVQHGFHSGDAAPTPHESRAE